MKLLFFVFATTLSAQWLPNPYLTPGAVTDATTEEVCTPGWARAHRAVTIEEKREVSARYGIRYVRGGQEFDHLVPLSLGGSNEISNVWPEPAYTLWNFHVKDALESRAHFLVCSGRLSLSEAQRRFEVNWIDFYKDLFRTDVPLTEYRRRRR